MSRITKASIGLTLDDGTTHLFDLALTKASVEFEVEPFDMPPRNGWAVVAPGRKFATVALKGLVTRDEPSGGSQ